MRPAPGRRPPGGNGGWGGRLGRSLLRWAAALGCCAGLLRWGYQDAAQCAGLQAGGEAPPRRAAWTGHLPQASMTFGRYRRAGGNVPATGKSLWSGCKTRRAASWRSAAKQEATEVPRVRHRLNLRRSRRGARQLRRAISLYQDLGRRTEEAAVARDLAATGSH